MGQQVCSYRYQQRSARKQKYLGIWINLVTQTSLTQAYSCAPWKAAKLTDEAKAAEKERRIKEAIENSDLTADKSLGEDDKYNTVIEDQYKSTSFPSDITYPAQLISEDGSKIYHGSFARIQFHVSEHISSLQIILGNLDKRHKDVSQFKATIRFPATAIRMMQIVENDKHGEYLSKDLDNKCWYMGINYNACYRLITSYITDEDFRDLV
ncbi:hypothetical protein HRR83_004788 [Exophiala dermatitidis]|uniref:Uncharacterized protein n=1 Tax=Exophiala dermatitidis TaxID=5970 RepID=A0AAN6EYV6_EXODE|nr:hypothetical protein HRR74_003933 [Exophiala dermatitidis]KAJ4529008.1 hypothetical protein HRR73_000028 [Exophiala dermatitidis]KAJ4538404.1 hypothetical protein HRR77_006889 [Exophiala dermatitidis]KAJ4544351.1 hypothetical protein HRR76_002415 [Exophiala dermatitidis]KAJ4561770.1 hypothetical protein HRR79_007105 [Exophiala dermatitidis]